MMFECVYSLHFFRFHSFAMDYGKFLSAAIVGTAAEQSGRLSYDSYFFYDPDNLLCADDLLDEEFPRTCEDDDDTKTWPFHILEDLCCTNIKEVVRIMKLMENGWKNPAVVYETSKREKVVMNKLWEYGEDYVTWQCEALDDVDTTDLVWQGKVLFVTNNY
ncbi:FirrV-1-D4 [Feldmannia irregularis virus a]|uniref:FirrV-1-D4 n=1 Tax=Feldmannia irregularis virus a TaxID=231992 RepID=Q6XLW5_9PHYC|nr:FirrV-1-D4 [Feldmannia irregularis virus a]AAR26946.1 FirrV-1-D4 [Feldmannia irregularis virus a]